VSAIDVVTTGQRGTRLQIRRSAWTERLKADLKVLRRSPKNVVAIAEAEQRQSAVVSTELT
jgi:hypothetical protein